MPEQDITVIQVVLHVRLVQIFEEAARKRGKSVQQLLSEAILEKADTLYNEDQT